MNINSQHHWVLGPELKTKNIFGFKGLLEFVKSHSGRSSGVFLMCKLNPDCFAVSNLPVQWLWLGLCTSAGMRWGCVARRWLRRLRIVAPEEQLVTWRWWHDFRWLTGVSRCSCAYLIFLECGDVMGVNVTQPSDHHFNVFECTLGLKFLAHTQKHTHK